MRVVIHLVTIYIVTALKNAIEDKEDGKLNAVSFTLHNFKNIFPVRIKRKGEIPANRSKK